MGVATRTITMASTAAVLMAACSTNATAHPRVGHVAEANGPVATAAVPPAPLAAPGYATPPDAEGNPPCPVADSWGKAPIDNGIFISYWEDQTDYVTALVRTSVGTDFAKSASIDPIQQPLIFDFPNIDAASVREVLLMTNVKRCFATPDPATSGR
jgi:hypothetical protein